DPLDMLAFRQMPLDDLEVRRGRADRNRKERGIAMLGEQELVQLRTRLCREQRFELLLELVAVEIAACIALAQRVDGALALGVRRGTTRRRPPSPRAARAGRGGSGRRARRRRAGGRT